LQPALRRIARQNAGLDMDDKDRLLMSLLKRDGRKPIVALARDLDLSRSATQERLAKLVSSGVIRGFTTIEEQSAVTQQAAHLLILLEKGKTCAQVLPKLKVIPHVTAIHSTAGVFDLVVQLQAASVQDLEQARSKIAAVAGVSTVTTLISLIRHLG
jgi:Lrp/AsnC family transcriptional regulator, leucine-responsive regulatory protein